MTAATIHHLTGSDARAALQDDGGFLFRVAREISHGGGIWPAEAVTRACAEEVGLTGEMSSSELRVGLEDVLMGRDVDAGLQWLQHIGFMALVLPEMEDTVSLGQEGGRKHKDVWEHTKLVVKQAVRRPAVRWAALLHDIGKVPTRRFTKNGGVTFHGHAEVGARMFDKVARRIEFPEDMRRKVRFLIKYHLRSAQYESTWSESAIRRFHREMEEHLNDLLDLSRADITSRRPGQRRKILFQISELEDRIEAVVYKDSQKPPLPKGIGDLMIRELGLKPSRQLGQLKQKLEEMIDDGQLEGQQEAEYYIEWIRSQPTAFLAPFKPD